MDEAPPPSPKPRRPLCPRCRKRTLLIDEECWRGDWFDGDQDTIYSRTVWLCILCARRWTGRELRAAR